MTGGYGHLGKAIVEAMIHHGANVYVLGRNEAKFQDSFGKGSAAEFEHCDISSLDSIKLAFENIYQAHGRIDVLVNNAYYARSGPGEVFNSDDFVYSLEGTLVSVFNCIESVAGYFKKQESGKIINVSSMFGFVPPKFDNYAESPEFLNPPQYGAAKAGVIQLTKYYAAYLGKYGVQVNCVSPGPFPSLEVQKDSTFVSNLSKSTLLGRIGQPEDLAGSFIFLSSAASDYITGQNLVVDGGWTTK